MIVWRVRSTSAFFWRAFGPHRMKTTWSGLASTARITSSVNVSHPLPWCDAGLTGAHRERRVEQQHALARPRLEVAVVGHVRRRGRRASSRWMLTSDGGIGHARAHREAQAVGLARAVVRVLAEDQHPRRRVRREVERGEHLVVGRVHGVPASLRRRRTAAAPASTACRTRRGGSGSSRSSPSSPPASVALDAYAARTMTGPTLPGTFPAPRLATLPTPLERGPGSPVAPGCGSSATTSPVSAPAATRPASSSSCAARRSRAGARARHRRRRRSPTTAG